MEDLATQIPEQEDAEGSKKIPNPTKNGVNWTKVICVTITGFFQLAYQLIDKV